MRVKITITSKEQNMPKHTPNVFIEIIYAEMINGRFESHIERIPVASLSHSELLTYYTKIDTTPIPKDSCIYNLYTTLYKKIIINAMSNETPMEWERHQKHMLNMQFCNPGKWGKCDLSYNPLAHCFENIKNGLCRDKYVIQNIGKIFFPDKYPTR